MTTSIKPNFKDPLDLIRNQRCTSDDVLMWLQEARREGKAESERLEGLDPASDDARDTRLRMESWSRAAGRLFDQYELMTRG